MYKECKTQVAMLSSFKALIRGVPQFQGFTGVLNIGVPQISVVLIQVFSTVFTLRGDATTACNNPTNKTHDRTPTTVCLMVKPVQVVDCIAVYDVVYIEVKQSLLFVYNTWHTQCKAIVGSEILK